MIVTNTSVYYSYMRVKYSRTHHSVMFTPNSIKHSTTHAQHPPTTKMTNGVFTKGKSTAERMAEHLHM